MPAQQVKAVPEETLKIIKEKPKAKAKKLQKVVAAPVPIKKIVANPIPVHKVVAAPIQVHKVVAAPLLVRKAVAAPVHVLEIQKPKPPPTLELEVTPRDKLELFKDAAVRAIDQSCETCRDGKEIEAAPSDDKPSDEDEGPVLNINAKLSTKSKATKKAAAEETISVDELTDSALNLPNNIGEKEPQVSKVKEALKQLNKDIDKNSAKEKFGKEDIFKNFELKLSI